MNRIALNNEALNVFINLVVNIESGLNVCFSCKQIIYIFVGGIKYLQDGAVVVIIDEDKFFSDQEMVFILVESVLVGILKPQGFEDGAQTVGNDNKRIIVLENLVSELDAGLYRLQDGSVISEGLGVLV